MLYQLQERKPKIEAEDCFIAHNAVVIGSVTMEPQSSVWYNVVIRGDNDKIHIGKRSNVQDGAILHTDPGFQLRIGEGVTVGHMAMLHGCEVGDNSLIGIKAVVMNGATIGANCLIGANSLIPEGKNIPDGSLVMGSPGRVIRSLEPHEIDALKVSADVYVKNGERFRSELQAI